MHGKEGGGSGRYALVEKLRNKGEKVWYDLVLLPLTSLLLLKKYREFTPRR